MSIGIVAVRRACIHRLPLKRFVQCSYDFFYENSQPHHDYSINYLISDYSSANQDIKTRTRVLLADAHLSVLVCISQLRFRNLPHEVLVLTLKVL